MQEAGDVVRERFSQDRCRGENADLTFYSCGVRKHVAVDAVSTGQHGASMLKQGFAGGGWRNAMPLPEKQGDAERFFEGSEPFADGRPNNIGLLASAGDA